MAKRYNSQVHAKYLMLKQAERIGAGCRTDIMKGLSNHPASNTMLRSCFNDIVERGYLKPAVIKTRGTIYQITDHGITALQRISELDGILWTNESNESVDITT